MRPDLKRIVADNLLAMLGIAEGERGATAALIKRGISNGDATRALQGQTSIGLDKLAELAAAVGCEPWQLCVPSLDPDRLPTTEPAPFRWPFHQVDPEVITGLAGASAQAVENGLLATLATAGIQPRKPNRRAA